MDTVLHEILPRKVRLWIYVIVFLALLVLTAWQASEGNLNVAAVTVLSALAPLLAAGNLPKPLDAPAATGDTVLVERADPDGYDPKHLA